MKALIKDIPFLSITSDIWKNKRHTHFLALTGHFMDSNFEYVSIILAFKKFNERHLAKNIRNFIKTELINLNISNKIVATTTDNAADIKKATNKFGVWISCFCHNLNLILKSIIFPKKKK